MYLLSSDFRAIASSFCCLDYSTTVLFICFSTLHIVGSFYLNFLPSIYFLTCSNNAERISFLTPIRPIRIQLAKSVSSATYWNVTHCKPFGIDLGLEYMNMFQRGTATNFQICYYKWLCRTMGFKSVCISQVLGPQRYGKTAVMMLKAVPTSLVQ